MKQVILSALLLISASLAQAATPQECGQLNNILTQQRQLFSQVSGTDMNAYRDKMIRVISVAQALKQASLRSPDIIQGMTSYYQQLIIVSNQNAGGPLWPQLNAALDLEISILNISFQSTVNSVCGHH